MSGIVIQWLSDIWHESSWKIDAWLHELLTRLCKQHVTWGFQLAEKQCEFEWFFLLKVYVLASCLLLFFKWQFHCHVNPKHTDLYSLLSITLHWLFFNPKSWCSSKMPLNVLELMTGTMILLVSFKWSHLLNVSDKTLHIGPAFQRGRHCWN